MEEKLELNLSFTKFTHPNYSQPTSNLCPPALTPTPALSPSSVIYPYINLNSPFPIMPSTPSSSFSPSSIAHSTPAASPPPSSPSTGIPSSQDANFIARGHGHANANVNVHINANVVPAHLDLPLPPPPATSTSPACAACKYQRRKCGNDCMLAPYFPPERQRDFQNAHRLFGVSNIVKKLRELPPSQRQTAVDTMVVEANMHAINPSGGCYSQVLELERHLEFLLRQLYEVRKHLASYKGQPVNFKTDPQEQQYADQSRPSFVSLDNVNPGPQNQGSEEQVHDYFYFDGNLIDERNNNSTDIGSHDIACNYLNNDYNHNEVEQETDRDEIRPFMDILPNCSDSEEGEEQLVCKSSADIGHMASLNSAPDKSTKCSLGLGFSAF